MEIYHGSPNRGIKEFDFSYSRPCSDYGRGVYFTTNFEQAMEWSCRHSEEGAVYGCEIHEDDLKIMKIFTREDEDLMYILYLCRIELEEIVNDSVNGFDDCDVIWGSMLAPETEVFVENAELFNEGELSFAEFSEKVKLFDDRHDQLCIKSMYALQKINDSINKIYYTQKTNTNVEVVESKSICSDIKI